MDYLAQPQNPGFQSSPGFEAGRYDNVNSFIDIVSVFQSSPGFEAGRYVKAIAYANVVPLFQSSPGFEAGRYPLTISRKAVNSRSNPRPVLRPGATAPVF